MQPRSILVITITVNVDTSAQVGGADGGTQLTCAVAHVLVHTDRTRGRRHPHGEEGVDRSEQSVRGGTVYSLDLHIVTPPVLELWTVIRTEQVLRTCSTLY